MLYTVASRSYTRYLKRDAANEVPLAQAANEVLSAHSTISKLVSSTGGTACFAVQHYLRYAQVSHEHGDSPQKEWRVAIGDADAQTARFVDEADGSVAAVIASLHIGSLVALDWLQVAVRAHGDDRVEHPCQKLEPISHAQAEKLLAAHDKVRILGLTAGMDTLLRSARSQPEALAALHAAQKHPRAMRALQDAVENGIGAVSKYSEDGEVAALLGRLEQLKLFENLPASSICVSASEVCGCGGHRGGGSHLQQCDVCS
jgi:hypothetical protein